MNVEVVCCTRVIRILLKLFLNRKVNETGNLFGLCGIQGMDISVITKLYKKWVQVFFSIVSSHGESEQNRSD